MKMNKRSLCVLAVSVCASALAADWPMWRHDANRSAASSQSLPDGLHLRWVRKLPAVQLTWPHEPRLHFDASHEPVVMGKTLFLGSANDGSVTAFDTDSGRQRWKFYTESPVRFAPVAWRGKVYVGSDDGHLYCLDASDGSPLWKVRGAPKDRPDRTHLGNGRLISYWPVRGGPVLADRTVYFAAGIWPTLGVFILAVDAGSGHVLWVNRDGQYIHKVRIDHNTLLDAGLSPQGYLAVVDDKLVVPNGRSMPARLDRKTGKLLYYVQGYRNGDCRVTAMGKHVLVGNNGVVNVHDGREAGSRWVDAGDDAPDAFDVRKFDLFEGPIFGYKKFPACNAWSARVPGIAYGSHQGVFYAYDLNNAKVTLYTTKFLERDMKPARWDAPTLWTLGTRYAKARPASQAIIKAGSRLYGHAGRALLAVQLPTAGGPAKVAWEHGLDGTPSTMLAADGKLFVVTKEGDIYCFGSKPDKCETHPVDAKPLPKASDRWTQTAADILERAGVSEGYCLVLGLGTGRLLQEVLQQSKLRVIAVDPDPAEVNVLRDRLVAAGLYGKRAEAFVGKPFSFPFPPYLASLIVSEDVGSVGFSTKLSAKQFFSVLRPYGGAACFHLPADRQGALAKWASAAKLPNGQVERDGPLVVLRRVGALPGSAAWTHETGDAARSYCSKDQLVKAPMGVLWYGDGADHGFYKNKDYGVGVKPQVVGGRLFAYQIFSRTLYAIDAYTGRLLWKRKVEHFTRYASMHDGVYVAGKDICVVCDPATGQARATFQYDPGGEKGQKPGVSSVRVADDVVLVGVAFDKVRSIDKGLWDSTVLVALDRKTGRQLWRKQAQHRFNDNAIALGAGMVFCTDSVAPAQDSESKRRGEAPKSMSSAIMALDARTGNLKWQQVTTQPFRTTGGLGIRSNDDWLAYSAEQGLLLAGKHSQMHLFDPKTGKEVWHKPIGGGQPMIVRRDTFITQSGHIFDIRTGRQQSKTSLFHRGGCNYAIGGEHTLFVRDRTACYVDISTRERHYLRNIRSGCSNSFVAADGVLNCPCFSVRCVCNYPIQTSFALVHMPEVGPWAGHTPLNLRAAATK